MVDKLCLVIWTLGAQLYLRETTYFILLHKYIYSVQCLTHIRCFRKNEWVNERRSVCVSPQTSRPGETRSNVKFLSIECLTLLSRYCKYYLFKVTHRYLQVTFFGWEMPAQLTYIPVTLVVPELWLTQSQAPYLSHPVLTLFLNGPTNSTFTTLLLPSHPEEWPKSLWLSVTHISNCLERERNFLYT